MPTAPRKGARRCFELTQDINHWTNHKKLWGDFKKKFPQYKDKDTKELKFLMDDFWKYCAKVLVETKDGIVLDRIGYFSMTVFSQKKMLRRDSNLKVDNGDIFMAYFYPIHRWNTAFNKWVFQINQTLKKRLAQKIRDEGFRYFNHIRILDKNSKYIKS